MNVTLDWQRVAYGSHVANEMNIRVRNAPHAAACREGNEQRVAM
jgi:hypothetical protein